MERDTLVDDLRSMGGTTGLASGARLAKQLVEDTPAYRQLLIRLKDKKRAEELVDLVISWTEESWDAQYQHPLNDALFCVMHALDRVGRYDELDRLTGAVALRIGHNAGWARLYT